MRQPGVQQEHLERHWSPSREGWILPGSEPHFGREEGWKSFGNNTPGVGWERKAAGSWLVSVVGACPTDSCRISLAPNHGDAGFWVILERVGVMARTGGFRSVLTTASAFYFILQSLFYCHLVQVLFVFLRKKGDNWER